jgi:hypothetical protein
MTTLSFTNLRVFIDESIHPVFTDLTNRAANKAEDIPFMKMPDLFMAAACVGAKNNKFKELSSKKKDIFFADAFDTKTHIPILIALAHKKLQNIDQLADAKLILDTCQGWANGGIYILQEQIMSGQGLRPLYRLVDFIVRAE